MVFDFAAQPRSSSPPRSTPARARSRAGRRIGLGDLATELQSTAANFNRWCPG